MTINNNIIGGTRLIIVANGNIEIADNVTRIDAWLIAPNGKVIDCKSRPDTGDGLDLNTCNQKLTINGLVSAKEAVFNRTSGAGGGSIAASKETAESINLPAASIVWAAERAKAETTQPSVVFTRELAPRL